MLTQAEFKEHTIELGDICPSHQMPLLQLDRVVKIAGEDEPRKPSPFCPECVKEQRDTQAQEAVEQHLNANLYQKTYNVLMRDSTNAKNLETPLLVFDGFIAKTDEEKRLLDFAKGQAQKYLEGMTGNTLLTGSTGIGKTHLVIALAKAINEGYKAKREPKSVLFINLTDVLRKIKASNFVEEPYYLRLMKEVDYLIINDLGVKMSSPNSKAKSAWEEEFIFDVLSSRENTIITTNLSNEEITKLYSERVASRVRTGLKGNSFKAFTIADKRYSIRELELEAQAQLAQRVDGTARRNS